MILDLRDEICFVHRTIKRVDGGFLPVSGLMQVIDEKEAAAKSKTRRSLATEVKSDLREMIKKAARLIDDLLVQYIPSDDSMDQHVPPEVFVMLEEIAVYISFAISCFTKPASDFFSSTMLSMTARTQSRARGYSTDSDVMHSDGNSVDTQDVLVDTLERLQDVCESFGAVPAHPDWLDTNCQLWEGISAE